MGVSKDMPFGIEISEKSKARFHGALVKAAGGAIITIAISFAISYIGLIINVSELKTELKSVKESNTAQWGVIQDLRNKNQQMLIENGVSNVVQREIVLPHLFGNHEESDDGHDVEDDLERLEEIRREAESIPEQAPESFGREQIQLRR